MQKILMNEDLTSIKYVDCINYQDGTFIKILLNANILPGKSVDASDLEKTILETLRKNKSACDLGSIIFIIKTIFGNFDERLLEIQTGKDETMYNSILYENGTLENYNTNFNIQSEEFYFSYDKERGFNSSTTNKGNSITNYPLKKLIADSYREEVDKTSYYAGIKGKKGLTDSEKSIYKTYSLFYNEEPDFRNQISSIKTHVMLYILSTCGLKYGNYQFPLENSYPFSPYLDQQIHEWRLLGKIESKDFDVKLSELEKKTIEPIGKLVREFINQLPKNDPSLVIAALGNIMYMKKDMISQNSDYREIAKETRVDEETIKKCLHFIGKIKSVTENLAD